MKINLTYIPYTALAGLVGDYNMKFSQPIKGPNLRSDSPQSEVLSSNPNFLIQPI